MKKFITLLSLHICFLLPANLYAQGIYQFWGTTTAGGLDDNGVFFSTKYDGTGQSNYNYFMSANSGRSWENNQPVAYNGKFYSILTYGGINNDGVICEYDPVTNVYHTRVHLYNVGLTGERGALTVVNNRLYGISTANSSEAPAILFEYNPSNHSLVFKHSFSLATGLGAGHEPLLYNGRLYGTTSNGGNNELGVIYEFNPASGVYTVKHHFTAPLKGASGNGLVLYGGKLWGVGGNDRIFSYDPATNIVEAKQDLLQFGFTSAEGRMAVLDNKLYGVSNSGGSSDKGFIYEYDPALNTLKIELHFTPATVQRRLTLLAYNGLLYGSGFSGGAFEYGELFSFNPVSNAYTTIKAFSNGSGGKGQCRLMLYNNKMYGWLLDGGSSSGSSSLFEYTPANNQFAIKLSLGDGGLQEPHGQLACYKNKLYGLSAAGGALKGGGIYAFDMQTRTFEEKVPMSITNGAIADQGGFLLYNDMLYGVTRVGGANGLGTLFKYDPNSNEYTKIFDFGGPAGKNPYGQLIVFNNRIFGTCSGGGTSDKGTIFEFNPFNNTVAARVAFSGANGEEPHAGLTVFHGRLFGVTRSGGADNSGVLYEYLPVPNSLVKLADFFGDVSGAGPIGKLAGYDNKLWGITASSIQGGFAGCIYQYDLALATLTKKKQLSFPEGVLNLSGLSMVNNKFYGMTNNGGTHISGVLYEYDPVVNTYTPKTHFKPEFGKWARRTDLAAVPAATSHGSPGSCVNAPQVNINAANASQWIPFTDAGGGAIAEINANGNILGNTTVRFFINDGNIRQSPEGIFYLDRNITITSANAPVTPVSIRLYIRKTEFESLKGTAGSGVNAPADLVIYKNNDFCAANISTTALPLPTTKEDWGFDYVYSTQVSSFSSFYFAKLTGALPVKIISFKGTVQPASNKLEWKAACSNAVDFIVERSADGIHFDSIGIKKAVIPDCDHAFTFMDETPLPVGYYRLKLLEDNGVISYADIVLLQRKAASQFALILSPNPVTGNQAVLQVSSTQQQQLRLGITDMSGRKLWNGNIKVNAGVSNTTISLPSMAAGVYYLQYDNGAQQQTIKLIKQ